MKTKICHSCNEEITVAYRVRLGSGKPWVFVCKSCCEENQPKAGYTYGGTWKGARH